MHTGVEQGARAVRMDDAGVPKGRAGRRDEKETTTAMNEQKRGGGPHVSVRI
jgi:hypothetical protein